MSDHDRRKLLAQYADSNAVVAKDFFNDASGMLFPPERENVGSGLYQGLSVEAIIPVLAKALKERATLDEPTPNESVMSRLLRKVRKK